jgi:glucose/arabinose dehydrogenase
MKIKFFSLFLGMASMFFGSIAVASEGMNVPSIKSAVVVSGLENPWDMAFTSGGDMFYTEKCKGLSVRTTDGKTHALYGMKGSSGYASSGKDLFCEGQAGMLGVALDRNFATNRTLYVYSTSNKYHGSGCKSNFEKCDGNIVMKFKASKSLKKVSGRKDIITDIQYKRKVARREATRPGEADRRSKGRVICSG